MKTTGFDGLMGKLKDLERAISGLDGQVAHLEFDPHDPQSIDTAIQQLYSAIDTKLASYRGNDIVTNIGRELKERGRQAIIDRATEARLTAEADIDNGEEEDQK